MMYSCWLPERSLSNTILAAVGREARRGVDARRGGQPLRPRRRSRRRHRCRCCRPASSKRRCACRRAKSAARSSSRRRCSSGRVVAARDIDQLDLRAAAGEADEGDRLAARATGAGSARSRRPWSDSRWLLPSLSISAMRLVRAVAAAAFGDIGDAGVENARRAGDRAIGEARAFVRGAAPVAGRRRRSPCGRARGPWRRHRRSSRRSAGRRSGPGRSR